MIRVAAPGLPPSPSLWFDPGKRQAFVSARFANWRSYGWEAAVTKFLMGTIVLGVGIFLWQTVPRESAHFAIAGFFFTVIATSIFFRLIGRGILARQVFPARLKVWFSEQGIAFQSGLYYRPVVIWRTWNNQPVMTQFIVQQDDEARQHLGRLDARQRQSRHDLEDAVRIEMVLSTLCRMPGDRIGQQEMIRRPLPIAQLRRSDAVRIATVLTAAATLTNPKHHPQSGTVTGGFDLDIA